MVWEGQGVIKGTRQLLGTTNPVDSMPGSIRGDFCVGESAYRRKQTDPTAFITLALLPTTVLLPLARALVPAVPACSRTRP